MQADLPSGQCSPCIPANRPAAAAVPVVSIIVISYNTREMTLECLRSVYATCADVEFELIVLDNASLDGSAEAIAAEFSGTDFENMRFLALEENLGFAKGNNYAALYATGDFLLLLNPDTVVLPNAVQNLLSFAARRPEAKVWGGRTLFGDGSLNPYSCWMRPTLWSLFCDSVFLSKAFKRSEFFNSEAIGNWQRDDERDVDIVTGCFFLTRTEFWRALEGFDERFFMYAEEADLCLRAIDMGAKPRVTPTAEIIHYGGASETKYIEKLMKLYAGKVSLFDKHWSKFGAQAGRLVLCILVLNRCFISRLLPLFQKESPDHRAKATWSGIWHQRHSWLKGYPE